MHALCAVIFSQQLSWVHSDEETVAAYMEYLADLVAAHAEYLSPCAYMLIQLFIYGELWLSVYGSTSVYIAYLIRGFSNLYSSTCMSSLPLETVVIYLHIVAGR